MIQQDGTITVRRQCELLAVCRSGLQYEKHPFNEARHMLMQEIDREHTDHPFMGSRQITRQLRDKGYVVHRSRIQRLMQIMGIYGVVPGPHTSKKHPSHKVYPYLLRGVSITRANQVWSTDITYIPFARGFFYLVAVQDWYSRKILSWRVSNTLDERFCIEALKEAIANYGVPEIVNSDQGAHFTADDWIAILNEHDIAISMDGKGRALDNVMVERFWRTIKYEWIFLNPAENGIELIEGITGYIEWYNATRRHSSLNDQTPDQRYKEGLTSTTAA